MNRPELSIVIPFLNEERVLPILRDRLEKVRNRPVSLELLFVVLTRNFGQQSAVSAGLSFASGKYIGIMDADLHGEPEEMYQFLQKEKFDVVYAIRASRSKTPLKRFFYFIFYGLYSFLADSPVQIDSGRPVIW